MFVVLEGGEGSGKSSLSKELLFGNQPHEALKEPCGRLREVIMERDWSSMTELFLFQASRAEFIQTTLLPLLAQGKNVVLDRYIYSTYAYQVHGRKIDADIVMGTSLIACGHLLPDLVLWLDGDPEVLLKRKGDGENRFDLESLRFHEDVRRGYLTLYENRDIPWFRINAEKPYEQVLADCRDVIREFKSKSA